MILSSKYFFLISYVLLVQTKTISVNIELTSLKISIIQMEIDDGNKSKNLDAALELINKSKAYSPDVVCLPELFSTGYDLKNASDLAEPIDGKSISKLSEIAKGNFAILGSFMESEKDKFYNCGFFIDDNGELIHTYRKVHLFSPMEEDKYLTPGNQISTFSFKGIEMGIGICYDLRFPEFFRKLMVEGAKIIFLPSEFPDPKIEIWSSLNFVRSVENHLFFVAINRVGKGKDNTFFGNSIVANGSMIQWMDNKPGIGNYYLDFKDLEDLRTNQPFLKDRRTDLY